MNNKLRIFTTLFIFGLFIEGIAFFVNQMENIPFVAKLISPQYGHSLNGLQKLESSLVIEPKDEGFNEFQEIFLNRLREQNPSQNIDAITVLKFQREGARMTLSQKRAKEVIPIKVFISNGQELVWNLEELTNQINNFKKKNTFVISIVIFLFGVAVQVFGFVIELKKKA
ncbi:MAG: hypothetical protein ISS81_10165 [Candidatus Marinimicrobia bacterium]|nr:hypothetical protein [Candidatus Neomarinimicrobiota bacterium]